MAGRGSQVGAGGDRLPVAGLRRACWPACLPGAAASAGSATLSACACPLAGLLACCCTSHPLPPARPPTPLLQGAKSPLLWEAGQVDELLAGSPVVAEIKERLKVRLPPPRCACPAPVPRLAC
jgi:hypothetical protein